MPFLHNSLFMFMVNHHDFYYIQYLYLKSSKYADFKCLLIWLLLTKFLKFVLDPINPCNTIRLMLP